MSVRSSVTLTISTASSSVIITMKIMKNAALWFSAFAVGLYTTFVAMYMWNWFAVPILRFPSVSFVEMLGLVWLISLLFDFNRSNVDDSKFKMFMQVLELCIPEERRSRVDELLEETKENLWTELAARVWGQCFGNTMTLLLGFTLNLFIK